MGKPEICASFIYESQEKGMQIPPNSYKRKALKKDEEFLDISLGGTWKKRSRDNTKEQEI